MSLLHLPFLLALLSLSSLLPLVCQSDSVRRIIFDTDPGLDDSFALMWLSNMYNHNLIKLEAITSVVGNSFPFETYRNMVGLVNLTTLENIENTGIEFGKYDENSTLHDETAYDGFHGHDGLHGLSWLFYQTDDQIDRIKFMYQESRFSQNIIIDLLLNNPFEITLIAVGPLTNLAMAEQQLPGILTLAKEILIMGGILDHREANTPFLSEFNFMADYKSLRIVLNSFNQEYNESPWNSVLKMIKQYPKQEDLYNLYSKEFGQIIENYVALYGDNFEEIVNTMNNMLKRLPKPNVIIFPLDITQKLHWSDNNIDLLYRYLPHNIQSIVCYSKSTRSQQDTCILNDENENENGDNKALILWQFLEQSTLAIMKTHFVWGYHNGGMFLHDPSPIGYLFFSKIYSLKNVYLDMFDNDKYGFVYYHNKIVPIQNGSVSLAPNVFYVVDVDSEKFVRIFTRDVLQLITDLSQN